MFDLCCSTSFILDKENLTGCRGLCSFNIIKLKSQQHVYRGDLNGSIAIWSLGGDQDIKLIAHRESNWIFSTESGQFQLILIYSSVSSLGVIDVEVKSKPDSKRDFRRRRRSRFDVVMVDLDASDARCGFGASLANFVRLRRPIFFAIKLVLQNHGVFVMSVVSISYEFYLALIQELKNAFQKVDEVDV
ncbi:hypothetical protein OSB04_026820 [Centaurea solstitialis]|uniref:Uncharacterized protein n=1 Tax=Centaurea solstitialis TaxID=347529 RepID=A0AA38SC84_9ASTR|nr:hypothetical protein OSB04_026820 [Centaurea solstitialis]